MKKKEETKIHDFDVNVIIKMNNIRRKFLMKSNNTVDDVVNEFLKTLPEFTVKSVLRNSEMIFNLKQKLENLTVNELIELEVFGSGLDIADKWKESYIKSKYIGYFIWDRNRIAKYEKNSQKIKNEYISNEIFQKFNLDLINQFSAFCNGNDCLFISGGDNKNFWKINLETSDYNHYKDVLPFSKKFHSMIFVPDNYVMIVGGNNKEVLYFNITEDRAIHHSTLNEDKHEPSLALVDNNILYTFSTQNNQLSIERISLSISDKWILLPKLSLTKNIFAISSHSKDELCLLGGYNDTTTYLYDINNNSIKATDKKNEFEVASEKFFLPFSDNTNILLSHTNGEEIKLSVYKEGEFKEISFELDTEHAGMERAFSALFK